MSKTYQFPTDFLWGTATAAFQVEGNNNNTDWWLWENRQNKDTPYPLEKSGIACDSYNRYEEDFDLCTKLNNNAVRISIEWARIQPTEDTFSQEEIEHYKKVLLAAKNRGLKTFVTLLHFTIPQWIAQKGGWARLKTTDYFKNYAKKCAEEFGELVDVFLTINEPLVYTLMSYIDGVWPPEREDLFTAWFVQHNLISAHKKAYKAIKSVGKHTVGIVKNVSYFDAAPGPMHFLDTIMCRILTFFNIDLHMLRIKNYCDVFGLNFYFTTRLHAFVRKNADDVQSDLGWWVYPKGLEEMLVYLKKYNLPIYVTENGIADANDSKRKAFIKNMLISCHNALEKGVNLKGYFYWSLIDNYEWHQGFWPRFGLVAIDREHDLKRIPRDSFYYYADISKSGRILE